MPVYDIDSILLEPDANQAVHALIDAIAAARQDRKLLGHECVIYHPYQAHWQILWNGIDGALFNLGLARLFWAYEGMKRVGAAERAHILKQAVDSFGSLDRIKELVKEFCPQITPEQKKLFSELETQYCDTSEDFYQLVLEYVKQHIEEFRSYQNPGTAQPAAAPNGGPPTPPPIPRATDGPPSVS